MLRDNTSEVRSTTRRIYKAGILQLTYAVLERESDNLLTASNALQIGWDNAPHHTRLATFSPHTHVGRQRHIQPSTETR
jgi:Family of unknown function (DUF6516)